ncbi:MAG: Na+/H+ antiporter NhaC family protein [Bdellovibrionales bacterium]|jgi:Na+/H+ antiporter NhaC|nr:Na+/H+ antiporter NhaC family protein [Bdellovibrionales bacterium]MBT3527180.1 Na+/H+ antiporter NhaC family protein [Bdellovibrionales bacterium]MBT7767192.1 Na+/H+ antiporter NhaC family protein [Bdellovibrionales bacterium]
MSKQLKYISTFLLFLAIHLLFFYLHPVGSTHPWYSITPPLMAICLAFLTHNLTISLGASAFTGVVLTEFIFRSSPGPFISTISNTFLIPWSAFSDPINLEILGFVSSILVLISILISSGGVRGVIIILANWVNSRLKAQLVPAVLGLLIFIDDYANTMIVGSTSRPLTDKFKISREKLAFLVDATSAPVAGISIVSTWIGFEVGLFSNISKELNFGKDGYSMFFDAISFRYYCIFMLFFVFATILLKVDFGPMRAAERRAKETGQLQSPSATNSPSSAFQLSQEAEGIRPAAQTAIIPLLFLLLFVFTGLWIDGGGAQLGLLELFQISSWMKVLQSSQNGITILLMAGGAGVGLAAFLALVVSKLKFSSLLTTVVSGLKSSLLPVLILVLAWSLKSVCDNLETGKFLAETLSSHSSPLYFPFFVFLLSAVTAFATGTSWGTMSILIPTITPVAFELDGGVYSLTTILTLASILDGSILGDHCSPISDTTIMSSISSSCDHIDHVKTQLPYSLFVGLFALMVGYIPAAFGISSLATYLIGISGILLTLLLIKKYQKSF